MKIDFKTGLRRIVLVFIGIGVLVALGSYCGNGFNFDAEYKFKKNIKIINEKNNLEMSFPDFIKEYSLKDKEGYSLYSSDFQCEPYKGICTTAKIINHKEIRDNKNIKLYSKNNNYSQSFIVKMPSKWQYLKWQVQDFGCIFLIAFIVYGSYLLIEKVTIWIFNGFKGGN